MQVKCFPQVYKLDARCSSVCCLQWCVRGRTHVNAMMVRKMVSACVVKIQM